MATKEEISLRTSEATIAKHGCAEHSESLLQSMLDQMSPWPYKFDETVYIHPMSDGGLRPHLLLSIGGLGRLQAGLTLRPRLRRLRGVL